MGSPYTHMGVIFLDEEGPQVYEAVGPVKRTPLEEWIGRGVEGRYVIKRLKDAESVLTATAITRMKDIGHKYHGKPYDPYFQWSDERIYCSELVWKIFKESFDIEVGSLQKVADFDLSDPSCTTIIKERFPNGTCRSGGPVVDCIDLEELAVSPAAIFDSELLEEVTRN